jgi:hypothetical protein
LAAFNTFWQSCVCCYDGSQGSVPDSLSDSVIDEPQKCHIHEDPDSSTASEVESAISDKSKRAKNHLLKQLLLHPDYVDTTSVTTSDIPMLHVALSGSLTTEISDSCTADNDGAFAVNAKSTAGNWSDDSLDSPYIDDKQMIELFENYIMDPETSMADIDDIEGIIPSDTLLMPASSSLDLVQVSSLPKSDERNITSNVQASSRVKGRYIKVVVCVDQSHVYLVVHLVKCTFQNNIDN